MPQRAVRKVTVPPPSSPVSRPPSSSPPTSNDRLDEAHKALWCLLTAAEHLEYICGEKRAFLDVFRGDDESSRAQWEKFLHAHESPAVRRNPHNHMHRRWRYLSIGLRWRLSRLKAATLRAKKALAMIADEMQVLGGLAWTVKSAVTIRTATDWNSTRTYGPRACALLKPNEAELPSAFHERLPDIRDLMRQIEEVKAVRSVQKAELAAAEAPVATAPESASSGGVQITSDSGFPVFDSEIGQLKYRGLTIDFGVRERVLSLLAKTVFSQPPGRRITMTVLKGPGGPWDGAEVEWSTVRSAVARLNQRLARLGDNGIPEPLHVSCAGGRDQYVVLRPKGPNPKFN